MAVNTSPGRTHGVHGGSGSGKRGGGIGSGGIWSGGGDGWIETDCGDATGTGDLRTVRRHHRDDEIGTWICSV